MGKHGVGERNESGERIIEFSKAHEIEVVNTFFKKSLARSITYSSGGNGTQVDNILCRRRGLKMTQGCKVLPGEAVAKQHKLVVGRLELQIKYGRKENKIKKTKWWILNDEEHRKNFVRTVKEKMEQRHKETPWETVSDVLRNVAKETLREAYGKAGKKEETWRWSEKCQKAVENKKKKKRDSGLNSCEETIREYKQASKEAKKEIVIAKMKYIKICMKA